MKPFAICITNNATAYGGAQSLRQVVLLVCIPAKTDNYDANGYVTSVKKDEDYSIFDIDTSWLSAYGEGMID